MPADLQEKIETIEKIVLNLEKTILIKEAEIAHFPKEPSSDDAKWVQFQARHDLIRLRDELRQALDDKKTAEFEASAERRQLGGLDVELAGLKREMAEIESRLNSKKEPPPLSWEAPRIQEAAPPPARPRRSPWALAGIALAALAGAAIYLSEPAPFDYGYIPIARKPMKPQAPLRLAAQPAAPKKQAAPVKKADAETPASDSKLEIDLNTVPPPSPEEPDFDWMDRYLEPGKN